MPTYRILRKVGDVTREEVDAAALRAIWCLSDYPGVRWLQSYWDREAGEIVCLYEAKTEQQVRDHAESSRIPCDDVRAVEMFGPDEYMHA